MKYSAEGLNLRTASEQVVLPVSEEACRQDPGLEAGRVPAAGLRSSPLRYSILIAGTASWENYSSHHPFVHIRAKLQFPEPFNESERMSMKINADDFCITPCTSGVLTGPWFVKTGTGEKPGSVSAVELWLCPPQ